MKSRRGVCPLFSPPGACWWAGHSWHTPRQGHTLERLQVGLAAWTSLHVCQCWRRRTQRAAVHAKLCPCNLVTPGCGWSKHNVQGTEVGTWANRSEVVSETTEQIFACSALREITERQPTKGGGVWWRQGPACLPSSAKDTNAKLGPFGPLKKL